MAVAAATGQWRRGGATAVILLYRRCGDGGRGRRDRTDGSGSHGGGRGRCGRFDEARLRVRTAVAARSVVDDRHRRGAAATSTSTSTSSSSSTSTGRRRRGLMCRQHRSTGRRLQILLLPTTRSGGADRDGGVVLLLSSLLMLLLLLLLPLLIVDGGGSAPVHLVGRSYNVSCCCCVGVFVCRWLKGVRKRYEQNTCWRNRVETARGACRSEKVDFVKQPWGGEGQSRPCRFPGEKQPVAYVYEGLKGTASPRVMQKLSPVGYDWSNSVVLII